MGKSTSIESNLITSVHKRFIKKQLNRQNWVSEWWHWTLTSLYRSNNTIYIIHLTVKLPGTKPHSVISSSAVENRVFLPFKCSLTLFELIFLQALSTNKCSVLSTFIRMALPPIDKSSPRAWADSSDVNVGACSTRLKLLPAVSNSSQMLS